MKQLLILFFCLNGQVFAQKVNAFKKFHDLFEQRDFNKLKTILDKNIIIMSENSQVRYNLDEYLDDMKNWAKVFNTKWNVVSVKKIKDTTYSVEYDSDLFKTYFYDGGNKVLLKYVEKKGKLVYLSWDDGEKRKREIFESRYKDFAIWCSKTHPDKYVNLNYQTEEALMETKLMLEEYLKEIGRIKSI
jgi:hypothetical protein